MFAHRFLGSSRGKHTRKDQITGNPIRSVLSTGREIRSDEGLMLETSALKLLLVASLRYTRLVILRPGSKVAFHMYRI